MHEWNPEPHWPSDETLIRNVVRNVQRDRVPRWAAVRGAFAVGSTVAHALCRRFGLDPDEGVH